MRTQKKFFFGRTMDPCAYDATLALALDKEFVVVVTAKDGKPRRKADRDLGDK